MKRKVSIFIIMLMAVILTAFGNNEVYAAHASGCMSSSIRESYSSNGSSSHTVKVYCNSCNGYLYQTSVSHNFPSSWTNDGLGKTHSKTCSKCGYKNAVSHSYGGYKYYNSTYHRSSCSSCSSYYSGSHSYTGTITTAATCTSAGVKTYKCGTCGHSYTEAIAALGHSAGAAATCTAAQKCTRCSATLANALGHNPGTAATCTAAQKCTRCSTTLANALGHNPGTAATCTAAQKCTRCSTTLANALGHNPGTAATCTAAQKCTRCSTTLANALGHNPGTAATCTTAQKCTRCSTTLANALGHDPGSAATCTTAQTCKRSGCGATIKAALGHSPGTAATCTTAQKCTRSGCGATIKAALGHSPGTAATCTTAQKCTRSGCGATLANALGHNPGTAATCTAAQKCTRCSTVLANALGHNPGTAATCTAAQKCTRCSTTLTNALGHNPGTAATCTTAQKCTRCSTTLTNALGHSAGTAATCTTAQKCTRTGCGVTLANALGHDPGSAATCTTAQTCKRSGCGATIKAALGHSAGAAATCTTAQKCTRSGCGATIKAALGHAPGTAATCTAAQVCTRSGCGATIKAALGHAPGTAATCTAAQKCTRCSTTLANALGHNPGTAATCTTAQKCTRCSTTLANALGHSGGTAATCTAPQKCTRCSTILVNALGHDWKTSYTSISATQHHTQKCSRCSLTQTEANHNWDTNHKCTQCTYQGTHSWGSWTITTVATCMTKGSQKRTCVCTAYQTQEIDINSSNHDYSKTCSDCGTTNVICSRNSNHIKSHVCDVTAPTIDSLTASSTIYTGGNITLTGKATDNQSGIVAWAFTNTNATPSSWSTMAATTAQITKTYTVVNVDTYYFWVKDASGNINSKSISIGKATNPFAFKAKTLTYNGAAQGLVEVTKAGQGTVFYSVGTKLTASNYSTSGNTAIPTRTDVDTYNVYYYITGNSNYNSAAGNVNVTINKKDVTVTANNQTIEYTGSIKQGVSYATLTNQVSGHTLSAVTLKANGSAVGTTTITPSAASIKNGSTDVTSNYNIVYANGTLTIIATNPTLTVSTAEYRVSKGSTVSPTYTYNGNGEITVSSSNSNIATAVVNNSTKTITITAKDAGDATITVTSAKTTQYNSTSKTITVRVFDITNINNVSTSVGKMATYNVALKNSYNGDTYSYQWQLSKDKGNSWTNINGATGAAYNVTTTEVMNGYMYRVVVKNNHGYSITSNSATLTTGWDISKHNDGSVIAYLTTDPANANNYVMTISGTGEMKNFADYPEVPWVNYRTKISKLVIEEGVKSIGDRAFYNLTLIKTISLPSTIKTIGTYAFYNCSNLTGTVKIPKATTAIGTNPFLKVPVTGFVVEAGNTSYKAVDGVLLDINATKLISYPMGATTTNYTVPSTVTTIDSWSCTGAKFTNITLPNGLKTIGYKSFEGSSLTEITIPNSVTQISEDAFNNATALQNVYLQSTSLILGKNAFGNLKSGSIIYTESKEIASKFVAGTNYTEANTSIYYPPVIVKHPLNAKSIWGGTAQFDVEIEEGNPKATYQWYKNGSEIAGATNATYITPPLVANDNGAEYYCLVYNADYYKNRGIVTSNTALLVAIDGRYSVTRGEEEIYFDSLQLAFDSLQNGESLNVKKNVVAESDAQLTGNKSIILNVNDYTITMENNATINIATGSKLTINGTGAINKTVDDSKAVITNNGALDINGNVKMSNTYGYIIDNSGVTTLNDGEYRGIKPIRATGTAESKIIINSDNVKVIAEGNMTKDNGAITLLGSSTLEMTKGSITASSSAAEVKGILVKENATANISGGTITASSSSTVNQADALAMISNGDVNISGNATLSGTRSGITLLDSNTGDVNITGGLIEGGQVGIFNNSNASVKLGNETDEEVGIISPEIRGEKIAYVSFKNNSQLIFYDGVLQSGGKNVIYQDVIDSSNNVITTENMEAIENNSENNHKIYINSNTKEPIYYEGYDIHLTSAEINDKTYDIGYLRIYTAPIVNGPKNVTVKLPETATFEVSAVGGVPSKYTYEWQVSTDGGNTWTIVENGDRPVYETPSSRLEMNGYRYRCAVSNRIFTTYSSVVSLTIDESSIQELPIDIVPIGKYTFPKGNVISKIDGKDAIELELVVKSTSALRKITFNGTELVLENNDPISIDNATIEKSNYIEIKNGTGEIAEYAYTFRIIVTGNGIYTAAFEDVKGHSNSITQTVDTFTDVPLTIEYIVEEPTLYREYPVVRFIANRGVKFVSPEAYAPQMNKQGNGTYVTKYTLNVYGELNNAIFVFADQSGYEKEVNVTVSPSLNKKIRLTSDTTALNPISINEAFEKAQKLENEVEIGNSNSLQYRYGVSNVQADMFMSRARDIGAATILANASVTKSYHSTLPQEMTGTGGSKLSIYGMQGVSNEYVAAFIKGASGSVIYNADAKYVDKINGSLNQYKGFNLSGFSVGNDTQPYVLMTGNSSATNVTDVAQSASFRITIINK